MKYLNICLLLNCFLFSSIIACAQSTKLKDTCIVLDAKKCCDNVKVPHYIKENSRVSLKILNVNPLVTKIRVSTSSDTIKFGDFPTVLNLQFGSDDKSSKTVSATKPLVADGFETVSYFGKPEKKMIKVAGPTHEDSVRSARQIVQLKHCYNNLQDSIYTLQRFLNLESRIKDILSTPIASKSDLQKRISYELRCFDYECDSCCCWYQKKYIALLGAIRTSFNCIKENYDSLTNRKTKNQIIKVSAEVKVSSATLKIKEQSLEIEGEKPTTFDEDYKKIKVIIDNLFGDSLRKIMDAKVQSLTNMCSDFNSIDTFVVCRNLLPATGDVYKINSVIITGPKGDTVWKMDEMPFTTYGGHRLNFSTGIGFSFFGLDKSFFKEKINDDTFKISRNNSKNWVLPTVAVFLHSYYKVIGKWQPAWTFGLSTNPANIESTRFFVGGSLIQGTDKRLVITLGVSAGSSTVLVGKFEEKRRYKYADYSGLEDADLTEKKLRINAFFGVSYNLSSKR